MANADAERTHCEHRNDEIYASGANQRLLCKSPSAPLEILRYELAARWV